MKLAVEAGRGKVQNSPRVSGESVTLPTSGLRPRDTGFELLASRTVQECISVILSPKLTVLCYGSPRKLAQVS